MKVLMIYPNKVMVTRAPLGIGYLSAYLKEAGHDFKLFDTTFVKCGEVPSDDALREKNLQVVNPDFEKLGLVEKNINVFNFNDILTFFSRKCLFSCLTNVLRFAIPFWPAGTKNCHK